MLPFFIIGITSLVLIVIADYKDDVNRLPETQRKAFNLAYHLNGLNPGNFKEKFPYEVYLDSADWRKVSSIRKDVLIMDSFSNDPMLSQEVLWQTLTEKLEVRVQPTFEQYNTDSLILLLQWVEGFKHYASLNLDNNMLFGAVYDHWMNFIIKTAERYAEQHKSIKYNYKFKYLLSRCDEQTYISSIGKSRLEKIVDNVIERNWSYLLNRFWIGTTVPFKIIIFSILFITLYAYICIFRFHFKSLKSNKP
jgi:hypothetical protein